MKRNEVVNYVLGLSRLYASSVGLPIDLSSDFAQEVLVHLWLYTDLLAKEDPPKSAVARFSFQIFAISRRKWTRVATVPEQVETWVRVANTESKHIVRWATALLKRGPPTQAATELLRIVCEPERYWRWVLIQYKEPRWPTQVMLQQYLGCSSGQLTKAIVWLKQHRRNEMR